MIKMTDLIIVAKITTPFGIKGLAKVTSFMQNPEEIFSNQLYGEDNTPYTLKHYAKKNNNSFIVYINDITDRTIIESLGKLNFYINKDTLSNLEEDEFYAKDLIGRNVKNSKEITIGIIKDTYNFGAGDILEVRFENGSMKMYPFLKVYFPIIHNDYLLLEDPEIN
jgi:16S rRNA processing protein RimM